MHKLSMEKSASEPISLDCEPVVFYGSDSWDGSLLVEMKSLTMGVLTGIGL